MGTNVSTNSLGGGFTGLLQVAFIVLKLLKVIDWSWLVVLLPTIISSALAVVLLIVVGLILVKQ